MDYPFAERLYPGALDVVAHLRRWEETVILSDGEVVFQPRWGHYALNPSYEQAGGLEEVRLAKEFYGWNPDARLQVPDGVPEHFREQIGHCGAKFHAAWEKLYATYRQQYPDLAGQIDRMQRRDLPAGWDSALRCFRQMRRAWRRATRQAKC